MATVDPLLLCSDVRAAECQHRRPSLSHATAALMAGVYIRGCPQHPVAWTACELRRGKSRTSVCVVATPGTPQRALA